MLPYSGLGLPTSYEGQALKLLGDSNVVLSYSGLGLLSLSLSEDQVPNLTHRHTTCPMNITLLWCQNTVRSSSYQD